MVKRKVVWQKWVDPFLPEENDIEDEDSEGGDEYKDSYQNAENSQLVQENKGNTGPIMVGPMGIIPLTEHNIPSKVYIFWMGHTNFDITGKIKSLIEETLGVETLDIFTRYRFRVAIGKAFVDEEIDPFGRAVLNEITEKLCKEATVPPKARGHNNDTHLSLLKNVLKAKHKHWAIFILEDGTLETKGSKNKDDILKEVKNHTNKPLATSWE